MAKCGCKRGGAMTMAGRKKGGMQQIGARKKGGKGPVRLRYKSYDKKGGKYTGVPPRSALKKGGQQMAGHSQSLGAGKGGGLFGTLKNKAIDAAAPYVTTEINKRLGSSFTQAQVKAVLKDMKLSDIKSPKKALMKVLKILKNKILK